MVVVVVVVLVVVGINHDRTRMICSLNIVQVRRWRRLGRALTVANTLSRLTAEDRLVSFTNPQKTGQINNKYSSLPVHDGIGKFPINHLILRPVLSDITCDVKNNIYVAIRSCSDPELTDITSAASIAREDVADSVDMLQV